MEGVISASCAACGKLYSDRCSLIGRLAFCSRACRLSDEATAARFESYISRDPGPCWIWIGCLAGRTGYGKFTVRKVTHLSHRYAYEKYVGDIPDGLQLDHICRVRNCCNPAHLEPVTARTNVLRGKSVLAANAAKTHCKRGHEFTQENTIIKGKRSRACRACRAADSRSGRATAAKREWKKEMREKVRAGDRAAPASEKKNYKAGFCGECGSAQFNLKRHLHRKHHSGVAA